MSDDGIITGLSHQQESQLRMVIRDENRKLLEAALSNPNRPPCERLCTAEDTLYGTNDSLGLKGRVTRLETEMEDVVWAKRMSIAAALGALLSVVVTFWKG